MMDFKKFEIGFEKNVTVEDDTDDTIFIFF